MLRDLHGSVIVVMLAIFFAGSSMAGEVEISDDLSPTATLTRVASAQRCAESIDRDVQQFASELRDIVDQSKLDLVNVLDFAEWNIKSAIAYFSSTMQHARSAGEEVERSCRHLYSEWEKFHAFYTKELSTKATATEKDASEIVRRLDSLRHLCSVCEQDSELAKNRVVIAKDECSMLNGVFGRKINELESQKVGTSVIGTLATVAAAGVIAVCPKFALVLGLKAVLGTSAKAAGGGLLAAIGVGGFTWSEVNRLHQLSKDFQAANEIMNTTLNRMNRISGLIAQLKEQTVDMTAHVAKEHGLRDRYLDTLKKERADKLEAQAEVQRLKAQLAKRG